MTLSQRTVTVPNLPPGTDLCLIPAGPAPNGRQPNFVDPPSLQPAVIAITTIMLTLASVVLAGRLFVNRKSLKLPDWMMVVGFLFNVVIMGTHLALSRFYLHVWDTPLCNITANYVKMNFIIDVANGPALFFPKAAIFMFYMQIFGTVRVVRIASIVGIIMAFIAYLPAALVLSYYDVPRVGQSWEELIFNDTVHKGIPAGITLGVVSVLVDVYIFVLPLPTLFRLSMPLAKRIQVIALFATAFISRGVAASLVCMVYRIKLLRLTDATWQAGVVGIPIIIESNVSIIVGSMPAFANFMRKYVAESSLFKSLRSRLFGSNSGSNKSWPQVNSIATIGGTGIKRKVPSSFELSERGTVDSQITVPPKTYTTAGDTIHEAGAHSQVNG
ncbi:hypothetical protein CC86DRAFT_391950 [Ophiobolus disseminans]|uniref:Rhodopsin domain-containing protein n=1 Tax=Ophiobolus disseminans TaxID=1469910 RepID=A0A6A7A9R2_9PLEO|nr:hypothetical protein CC86DRAFT_391950 [Ophiobolus disseminans]